MSDQKRMCGAHWQDAKNASGLKRLRRTGTVVELLDVWIG